MRKKTVAQRSLFEQSIKQLATLVGIEDTIKRIDAVIDDNPSFVELVHADLTRQVTNTGACGMSAEQVLRAAVIKQLKQYTWRELHARINDGIAMRWFTRLYDRKPPHYTALQKAIGSISAATWNQIHEGLVEYAHKKKVEKGRNIRTDTTVIETNIAYPIDARLLWDGVRVLTRLMNRLRKNHVMTDFGFANRGRKTKKLCYQITMVKGPKADKVRRKLYRRLIKVANEVFAMGCRCFQQLPTDMEDTDYDRLDHFLTMMAVAIDQCERRVIKQEKVPSPEKIVSLFEDHTDIICRGKTTAKTEFGHKVLFVTGKSGLITQYLVLRGNPGDSELWPDLLKKHKRQYGYAPNSICADRRFFSDDNQAFALTEGVKRVSVCKPGYRSKKRRQFEKEQWFRKLQRFRAGIEGIISGLMRGLGLKRCPWKGWAAFKRYVALSVVTFNMRKIALSL